MTPPTLAAIEAAIRAGWGRDTCDPDDLADGRPNNPARGQCGPTALVLHDLIGGDLVLAEVRAGDGLGCRVGYHWWNRVGVVEVDLTREQFAVDEVVGPGEVVARPPGPPKRCREQYELLRARVFGALDAL
ncbi:YunG family protein [Actinokineospora iranica]|uniref:Uncharacterized protein n=1 Tax=Actinokineospora iranica TaxID=1271860 RepID=A0A1G6THZ1_9PSEU|nr:hypothetical protein [Actinokineospora iranica]SDD28136.1 hypothetical protein SAMN05216174_109133 [Actinokineospora iranica]